MQLASGEIRPGVVRQVVNEQGTVKAWVEGLFQEDDLELLPPIRLFMSNGRGSFSMPEVGDPIWVLYFRNNPQNLLYVRQANFGEEINDVCSQNDPNTEVIMRRTKGFDDAQLLYTDGKGWTMANAGSKIKIDNEKNITLSKDTPSRTIEINESCISLGSKGKSAEPAVLGDKMMDVLIQMDTIINAIVTAAKSNPYTMPIATAVEPMVTQYEDKMKSILSTNVRLD